MKLMLFAVPAEHWNTQVFAVVSQQAKDSARKIGKDIDLGIERKRFTNACARLENMAIANGREIAITDNKVQEILNSIKMPRMFLPFIEPEAVKNHERHFDEVQRKYLRETKSTIVFIVDEYAKGDIKLYADKRTADEKIIKSNVIEFNDPGVLSPNEVQKRFHQQILMAVEQGIPVGWINVQEGEAGGTALLRHEGIITCLREHIFSTKQPQVTEKYTVTERVIDKEANLKRSQSIWFQILNFFSTQPDIKKKVEVSKTRIVNQDIIPRFIRFAFKDGSISENFPLYALMDNAPKTKLPVLKVALISNRHFELDKVVDTCILRNSEISRREDATIADQEMLSFNIAVSFFQDILAKTSGAQVDLYHTGLEPAVLGTYRAFLSVIIDKKNRGKLVLVPKMPTRKGDFSDLKYWY